MYQCLIDLQVCTGNLARVCVDSKNPLHVPAANDDKSIGNLADICADKTFENVIFALRRWRAVVS